jgi:hypothetical protein
MGRYAEVTLQQFYPGVPICQVAMHCRLWEGRVPDDTKAG